jgi:hypothetical protein
LEARATQVNTSIQDTQREGLGPSAAGPQDIQNPLCHKGESDSEVRHQLRVICPKITVQVILCPGHHLYSE